MGAFPVLLLDSLPTSRNLLPPRAILSMNARSLPSYGGSLETAAGDMERYLGAGCGVLVLCGNETRAKNFRRLLEERNIRAQLNLKNDRLPAPHETVIGLGALSAGSEYPQLKLVILTEGQLTAPLSGKRAKARPKKETSARAALRSYEDLSPGDLVVHVHHGIGRFAGIERMRVDGVDKDYIKICYAGNDSLYVPATQLDMVSKYIGGHGEDEDGQIRTKLSKLGGTDWSRAKTKARAAAKDLAKGLIALYAERQRRPGFAFSPDSPWQKEFEEAFDYEETDDQLRAIAEIKADMERSTPMDRLLCGDVGYGKTEVALRAVMKCVLDGKQAAILVPTTVLAQQHYATALNRFRSFPVRIEVLSRFKTPAQKKQILQDAAAGKIDLLIGTHSLLQKSLHFKDLGLLIIDEEQRFGVTHKEKLKELSKQVDTLTLSATPIPRTLQFSLMGARDMSIMRTPPPNRYPIHTELCTFSHEVIADAINFEMSRSGQVFFVSDRISSLPHIEELIHQYVPDCRVAIGHGQMAPEQLEKIIMGFINYDYDVLLSTTIVENGVDIPNANTIIVNDAHHFGLSDLHQMRGRVGRSNQKAFCYLMAPPRSSLTPEARRRLEALETFSDLGSGFNLAMQDLDIRGAGNLLGSEQSGFMEDLGYETYQKILNQAVTELKNDEFQDLYADDIKEGREVSGDEFVEDCAVESDLPMFFPDTYVPTSSERMLLYRELDNISDDDSLKAYRQRIVDRFGPVPREGEELMQVVLVRRLGRKLGCEKIMLRQGVMSMQFVSNQSSPFYQGKTFGRIIKYVMDNTRRCNFKDSKGHRLIKISNVPSVAEAVVVLKSML